MSSRNGANLFEEKTKVKVEKPDMYEKKEAKSRLLLLQLIFFSLFAVDILFYFFLLFLISEHLMNISYCRYLQTSVLHCINLE